jgi:2-dehydro-3-deoxyphosphogluconate aldolase/(4S)-4-hydroxy-2-oxoglutarate aldolase
MSAGLAGIKFFPTGPTTGIPIPKALTAPQGVMCFIPAGGIGPGNLHGRLILNAALACKASWLVDPLSVPARRFHRVQRLTVGTVAFAQAS